MEGSLELWIGLVHLRPQKPGGAEDILEGAAGALTNVVTWAQNPNEFRKKAETLAAAMELCVVEIEDERPLHDEAVHTEAVEDMLLQAESDPNAIIYGTFHLYMRDDA
jgi:hypothetical protein